MQLTREFFDTLIIAVILVGLALAAIRLYADFTRPLPPETTSHSTESQRADEQ